MHAERRATELQPVLRCEIMVPLVPARWLWTYVCIKGGLLVIASIVMMTLAG